MVKSPARIPIGKLWSRQQNEAIPFIKGFTQPGRKSPFGEPVPNLIREGWGRIFTFEKILPLRGVRGVYFGIEKTPLRLPSRGELSDNSPVLPLPPPKGDKKDPALCLLSSEGSCRQNI